MWPNCWFVPMPVLISIPIIIKNLFSCLFVFYRWSIFVLPQSWICFIRLLSFVSCLFFSFGWCFKPLLGLRVFILFCSSSCLESSWIVVFRFVFSLHFDFCLVACQFGDSVCWIPFCLILCFGVDRTSWRNHAHNSIIFQQLLLGLKDGPRIFQQVSLGVKTGPLTVHQFFVGAERCTPPLSAMFVGVERWTPHLSTVLIGVERWTPEFGCFVLMRLYFCGWALR